MIKLDITLPCCSSYRVKLRLNGKAMMLLCDVAVLLCDVHVCTPKICLVTKRTNILDTLV